MSAADIQAIPELPISSTAVGYLREVLRQVCCGLDESLIRRAVFFAKQRGSDRVENADVKRAVAVFIDQVGKDIVDENLPDYYVEPAREMIAELQRLATSESGNTVVFKPGAFGQEQIDELESLRQEHGAEFGVRKRAARSVPTAE
ncbi:MAG TPA: hypothetical protein PK867_30065 [Pirellulales bacterium]|nr:hypothetical protein [Pirellulales bacterium]